MIEETSARAASRAATEAVAQYLPATGINNPPVAPPQAAMPRQADNRLSVSTASTSDLRSRTQLSTHHREARLRRSRSRSPRSGSASPQHARSETHQRRQRSRSPPRGNASHQRGHRGTHLRRPRSRSPQRGNASLQHVRPRHQEVDEVDSQASRPNHSPRLGDPNGGARFALARRSPFTAAILTEMLPPGVKVSALPQFEGTGDPQEHIEKFYAMAELYGVTDALLCKMFRTTLSKRALHWFNTLPAGSIATFSQLSDRFTSQFAINREYAKTPAYLFTIAQKEGEALRSFIQRFVEAIHEVPQIGEGSISSILQHNLRQGRFKESIAGRPPTTLAELLSRAEKYVRIEEASGSEHSRRKKEDGRHDNRQREDRRQPSSTHRQPSSSYGRFTPLNAQLSEVLHVVEQRGLVEPPRPMHPNPKRQRSDEFCDFHKDNGHATEQCIQLKIAVEKLIKAGHLSEFVDKSHNQQYESTSSMEA